MFSLWCLDVNRRHLNLKAIEVCCSYLHTTEIHLFSYLLALAAVDEKKKKKKGKEKNRDFYILKKILPFP